MEDCGGRLVARGADKHFAAAGYLRNRERDGYAAA